MSFEMNVMYSSLFDSVFADSFFSPMRTVYVVSDSQLEELKRKQHQDELDNIEASRKRLEESYQTRVKVLTDREHELQEELDNIETSRKRLEENYQARVKVLEEREHELQEEIKALAPAKKKKEKVTA